MSTMLLIGATLFPLMGSVVIAAFRPIGLMPGRVMTICCGVAAAFALGLLVWAATEPSGVIGSVEFFAFDRTAAMLLAAVAFTGVVIASFARRNIDVDAASARFFGLFGLLVTGSALVVVPGNPWFLVLGWVGSSWALVGLVGHAEAHPEARLAQRRTALALMVGDIAVLAAVVLAVRAAGADVTRNAGLALDDLRAFSVFGTSAAEVVAVLLVVAGISKSALFPLHRWLVGTLIAPTAVSALVHAGFVSGAGLLLVRFAPVVVETQFAIHLAFAVGAVTTVVAICAAATRIDVKGKLAWSTVSQMGFMVVQCAVGAFSSAVFHIIGHGMYKASMFLGAGDAISSNLRSKRRAAPAKLPTFAARIAVSVVVATASVGIGMTVIPPDVSDGGVVLVAAFAWLTVANGVAGWLGRGAMNPPASIGVSVLGGFGAAFVYLGGLRAVEAFLEPALSGVPKNAGVDAATLIVVLALVVLGATVVSFTPLLRQRSERFFERTAHPGVSGPMFASGAGSSSTVSSLALDAVAPDAPSDLSRIRADVARARSVIAPLWPLTSVVAVNPLGGLEDAGFDRASEVARTQLRARTHLTLDRYRQDHAVGRTTTDDLHWAIEAAFPQVIAMAPVASEIGNIEARRIIELDLLHGPDSSATPAAQTAVERFEGVDGRLGELIDRSVTYSVAQYVGGSDGISQSASGFPGRWRSDATSITALRREFTHESTTWLNSLPADPAAVIAAAFAASAVAAEDRVGEMRGQLVRLNGWAGYARWRTEWAHDAEERPVLSPIDIVAARCALEAAALMSQRDGAAPAAVSPPSAEVDLTLQRVDAVLSELGISGASPAVLHAVTAVVGGLGADERASIWLAAQERHVDNQTLGLLDRPDPGESIAAPDAQLVFCIDVRSEGLRRRLESTGAYNTLGFAGFFGVPMAVRRIEWEVSEPRCPVLVAPSVSAVESPRIGLPGVDENLRHLVATSRRQAAGAAVHAKTKSGAGAAFAMAETAGWIAGPVAAARTLLPTAPKPAVLPATTMEIRHLADPDEDRNQRVDIGEAVLKTMGLIDRFAPLVVLCGHTSSHVNNPHATALDCGACAGASGQDNARAVAALLNETTVRDGLVERGITIPASTHFVPALHDTVSDRVDLLDLDGVPQKHQTGIDTLRNDLATAARANTAQRSKYLPGRPEATHRRGTDWAQVRPEWGLARNASFIIGPRSLTAGLDLDGRSFLHSYDSDNDPDGKVLETIMTAPLVVAHWISSQYYFSTVDPERFGAGDKLLHNIVGDTGVMSGEHGDLRVGLPLQSTHLGSEYHHQPVRLLAVVQAPLERIERIIEQNPILTTLIGGSWMRLAGRSHPHERWSMRTPDGTWSAEPRPIDNHNTLEN